jgi:hypothetical protein
MNSHELAYQNVNIFQKHLDEKVAKETPALQAHGDKMHAGFNPYDNNEGTVIGKWRCGRGAPSTVS